MEKKSMSAYCDGSWRVQEDGSSNTGFVFKVFTAHVSLLAKKCNNCSIYCCTRYPI
jgi:hypothetical protein